MGRTRSEATVEQQSKSRKTDNVWKVCAGCIMLILHPSMWIGAKLRPRQWSWQKWEYQRSSPVKKCLQLKEEKGVFVAFACMCTYKNGQWSNYDVVVVVAVVVSNRHWFWVGSAGMANGISSITSRFALAGIKNGSRETGHKTHDRGGGRGKLLHLGPLWRRKSNPIWHFDLKMNPYIEITWYLISHTEN